MTWILYINRIVSYRITQYIQQRRGSLGTGAASNNSKNGMPQLTIIESEAYTEPIRKPLRVTSYTQGGRMVSSLAGSSSNCGKPSSSSSSSSSGIKGGSSSFSWSGGEKGSSSSRKFASNNRPSYTNEEAVEEAMSQRQKIAQEILTEGCVQAYVDFFYLTHRPDPRAGKS